MGIDPSLTGTGLARIVADGQAVRAVSTMTVVSQPGGSSVEARLDRLDAILSDVEDFILPGSLAVIESPAYSRSVGARHERSGLWWMIARAAKRRGCRVLEVSPKTRAKYASGDGNANKAMVTLRMREAWPRVPIRDHNEADALALAALGMRLVGFPVDPAARYRSEAVEAVKGDL